MTWDELFATGKPFVICFSGMELILIPLPKDEVYFQYEDGMCFTQRRPSGNRQSSYVLVDYFEDDTTIQGSDVVSRANHPCTCDLYSVLLRTGCTCGGI